MWASWVPKFASHIHCFGLKIKNIGHLKEIHVLIYLGCLEDVQMPCVSALVSNSSQVEDLRRSA